MEGEILESVVLAGTYRILAVTHRSVATGIKIGIEV